MLNDVCAYSLCDSVKLHQDTEAVTMLSFHELDGLCGWNLTIDELICVGSESHN